jgi:hypothetical protein
MVFQVLREHKLYAKLNKCDFIKNNLVFGSHYLKEGISVDSKKIEAIMNWPTPRNVRCEIILWVFLVITKGLSRDFPKLHIHHLLVEEREEVSNGPMNVSKDFKS